MADGVHSVPQCYVLMYSFGISTPFLLGQPLARAERRRCQRYRIPGIGRKVMRCAFDFEKKRTS
jgi:hypothetical protein